MGYLGNTPGENFITFSKQVFTIVNSQTAYTLNFSVVDENELRLVINNVVQEPGTGKAYTASGTTLTLASALTNGTDEMYCVFLGKARETVTVPTITKDKLNLISNATAGIEIKGDGGSNDGYLQLNCSQNSHGVKIKSPPHSAGQSYTLTLPQSITNNTFLKTDGSGNLSFASAGGSNSPRFRATMGSNQTLSDNVAAKIAFNTEDYDVGSCFDTSNYRFTVPSGEGGLYLIYSQIQLKSYDDGQHIESFIKLYKNGSANYYSYDNFSGTGNTNGNMLYNTQVINLSASDYIEVYGQINVSTNSPECKAGYSYFQGFKLIT